MYDQQPGRYVVITIDVVLLVVIYLDISASLSASIYPFYLFYLNMNLPFQK